MAKFHRASLLLALCVTVIISPYMPLSQCFYLPPKPVPPMKPLLQCANLPFKPGPPMKPLSQSANLPPIKRPEILSRKVILVSRFPLIFVKGSNFIIWVSS